jgi:MFS family permease
MDRNITLYPWFKFCQNLLFWQAVWFLYFQNQLSAGQAILLYAVYDISTTALEVPSGYMSDRLGRRLTLIAAMLAMLSGGVLLALGSGFVAFALAQVLLGAATAFASGTDNAILYESLAATDRVDEIQAQELRAWRFTFAALALSAVLGGIIALYGPALPFVASAVASGVALILTLRLREPSRASGTSGVVHWRAQATALRTALTTPVLVWLFWISVLMYVFSHIPFVFGQPFILDALKATGLAAQTPAISGTVTALMMVISLFTSLIALRARRWLGLPLLLLTAFGMQIALGATLALTNSALAIAVLFLRMVPDSLSRPFIVAHIQPLLGDDTRATYLSLQSLCGRLVFAGTLLLASGAASGAAPMSYPEIQTILGWYTALGLICFVALALSARLTSIRTTS